MYQLVGGNAPEVEVTVRPQGHRRQKRHVSVISDRRWIQILDYDTLLTHPASKSRRFNSKQRRRVSTDITAVRRRDNNNLCASLRSEPPVEHTHVRHGA